MSQFFHIIVSDKKTFSLYKKANEQLQNNYNIRLDTKKIKNKISNFS